MSKTYTNPLPGGIPSTHKEHTESRTTILLPKDQSAFLNPPQQFNRDLSVAVIRAWNERRIEDAKSRWEAKQARKGKKGKKEETTVDGQGGSGEPSGENTNSRFQVRNIRIIEALSATGLRSIRYAKEIPNIKTVLANDLSASACEAMRMNVAYNGVGEDEVEGEALKADGEVGGRDEKTENGESSKSVYKPLLLDEEGNLPNGRRKDCKGRVKVNEGDAWTRIASRTPLHTRLRIFHNTRHTDAPPLPTCTPDGSGLMYSHRDPKNRVEVVDLDPYGTAVPFIDSAIQSIADGGLLCVTCTDTAVFAGSQYPEKSFANYGGASVNAEYCHEVGLRLVLNSLANAAARYGRCITPLLSFSIDFYVRVFVTVDTAPVRVKEVASNTGIVYVCSHCQSWEVQPIGRVVQDDKGNKKFKSAPKSSKGAVCEFCDSVQHVGGPMWIGPIQDQAFAQRCLKSIDGQQGDYATWTRMHGMLTIASNELENPFYFTCNKISSFFRSTSAPTSKAVSALLNAGYKVSRSHACAGSVKTDAPRSFIFDIMREYIKENPVKMEKIAENNPARVLLAKESTHNVDLTLHPDWPKFEKGDKVVFYQTNPLPNWGPAARAKNVTNRNAGSVVDAIEAAAASEHSSKDKEEDKEVREVKRKAEVEVGAQEKKVKVGELDEEEAMNM